MSDNLSKNLIIDEGTSSKVPKGNNHLFVIGINDYQHVGKLNNARGDAEALVQLLQTHYQFEPENTTILYDQEASRSAIIKRLLAQLDKLASHDNLVIFFSGHGHFEPVLEEGYWVPVDADYQAIDTYVSYDFLQKIARAAKHARHVLFIVDSCYSGAVLVKSKDTNQTRLEKDPSRWIIASGRNEVVPDGKIGGNSPFAGELLELLQQHANEGIHTLRLIDLLTENVSWNSHQTPIGQPLHGVGHKGGQFVFHVKRNEKRDWQEAQENNTAAAYEGYLKAWPEAVHTDTAAWCLAKSQNTRKAYRRYLERKEGSHRILALDQLEALEDKQRFQKAKLRGEGALIRFYETYPDSAFREAAQAEIIRIRTQDREPEVWRVAKAQGSAKAFQNYLNEFPEGEHADEAHQQLTILEAEQKRLAEEKAKKAAREKAAQAAEARRQEEERIRKQAEAQKQADEKAKNAARKQQYEKWWFQAEANFERGYYASARDTYAKALKLAIPANEPKVKARIQQCRDEISFRKAFDRAQQAQDNGNSAQAIKALQQSLQYPSQRQAEAQALLADLKKQPEQNTEPQELEVKLKQQYQKYWSQAESDFERGYYASARNIYAKALKLDLPEHKVKIQARIQKCRDEMSFRKAFDRAQQVHKTGDKAEARKALRQALQYPSQRQAEAQALLDQLKVPLWQQASVRYGGLAVLVILLSWGAWTISQGEKTSLPEDRYSFLLAQADSTFSVGKSQRSLEIVEQAEKLYAEIPSDWNQAMLQAKARNARAWVMAYYDSIQQTTITEPAKDEVPATMVLNSLDILRDQGYQIGPFVDGVAIYSLGSKGQKKMGLLNQNGELLGKTYYKVEELANGYAVYHQNGKRGYLEAQNGKILIPARFEAAWPFEANGQAKVREEGRLIYINTKGECVRDCEKEIIVINPKEIPIPEMVWVEGGEFDMGSNDGDNSEKPVHGVKLDNFSIGKYEVTQGEWKAVMGDNPSRFKCEDCPVEQVSWKDAQQYIRKLNQLTTENFRLPTEAEWEYAARGGQKRKSTTYAGNSSLSSVGWYISNSGNKTHPVGQKQGNELGLYDMSGNVWEWCADWYGSDYYASSPSNNPKGPSSGDYRVARGGGWEFTSSSCRVADRLRNYPDDRYDYVGFRLAKSGFYRRPLRRLEREGVEP